MDPRAFCDSVSVKFKDLFKRANVEPYDFIRTSEQRHYDAVNEFWNVLDKAGYIFKGYHEGWYSVSDECFVPESQIEDRFLNGKSVGKYSKESGKKLEWTKEENYKFKLGAFRERLIKWLLDNPRVIVPSSQYKEILNHLQGNELGDLSISRLKSRVSWGITVPTDDEHVIYVWLDALTNYLTVSRYPNHHLTSAKGNNPVWPAAWHIVGKDILKFHAIYWPAFLMAANLPLPQKILSHGHWLVSNQKMSKSSGNGVDAVSILEKYGVDAIRYFLLRDGGIGINPEFSMDTIWRRYKHDLAGQLGNLAMRATSLKINPTGKVPDGLACAANEDEEAIMESCRHVRDKVDAYFEQGQFADGLASVSELITSVNRYWSLVEPWHLNLNEEENRKRLENILFVSCEALRISGILLQPAMPETSKKLLDMLLVGEDDRFFDNAVLNGKVSKSRTIRPAKALFPQIKP